ncbi:hypothetical protein GCM10011289_21090 [Paludibacterium paludis]|uniref:Thioesterase putative domain-containing protein n=2 Tax=Paludibacterium paludis TaxID=1225769 RepID=A0A918P358_9NEIS|nr:hypothetical protein GCM10011289_21090 [Paludibacterium paludis]
MGAIIRHAGPDRLILDAPLAPNLNHHGTLFGGSGAALAILAAWSLVHVRLADEGLVADLVIQRHAMEYEKPVAKAVTVEAMLLQEGAWPGFLRMLERKGRARIAVLAVLLEEGEVRGRLSGEFVAMKKSEK